MFLLFFAVLCYQCHISSSLPFVFPSFILCFLFFSFFFFLGGGGGGGCYVFASLLHPSHY